ncbi:MAG: serine hydroxymethyltransferase, partial [Coriobacteriales bacterium]|jgi:glycine hydroxymethyltransferase|nr:serine hydroxymethyltransferase [Coriobacteriales bacterium]
MDEVERIARATQPKMIIAGASAYPRALDFARFAEIAHSVGAALMVDIAHIAGLVAGGAHPSPVPHADIVTSTTHKTLRGPRGGFLLTNDADVAARINKAIFPGSQGGPLQHVIAGKAVAFGEALSLSFQEYTAQVVLNMKAIGHGMEQGGLRLVSGGTDNHLALVDLTAADVTGAEAETILDKVGMTVNKNVIPNEKRPPAEASGIRVGSAAMTTRGFNESEAFEIGRMIADVIFAHDDPVLLTKVRNNVTDMLAAHPLYPELL